MRCDKCPGAKKCGVVGDEDDCCFGKPERPWSQICQTCDVIELCEQCSGAGMDTVVILKEES